MKKTILFLGDSFTWGEGLELYCDTPKWKNERFIENTWHQLLQKQDTDAIKFRKTNRYPTLISNELNSNIIVDKDNGGSLRSFIRLAESSL
jgi:lysophospholipase L1-like esterase